MNFYITAGACVLCIWFLIPERIQNVANNSVPPDIAKGGMIKSIEQYVDFKADPNAQVAYKPLVPPKIASGARRTGSRY